MDAKKKLKTIGFVLNTLGIGFNLAASAFESQAMTIEMSEIVQKEVSIQTLDLRQKLLQQMADNQM